MNKYKVSVIIPTYNQVERLKIALRSLLNQNFDKKMYEIIVINDGSTDNTRKYLESLNIENLIYISFENNRGRAYARNCGVRKSVNELLIFVDGDRVCPPDFIENHVKAHIERPKSVILGSIAELYISELENFFNCYDSKLDEELKKARYFNYFEFISQIYNENGETNDVLCWTTLFTSNFSIEKTVLDEIGKFDEEFKKWGLENFELGYRLYINKIRFVLNREAINYHLFHTSNNRTGEERLENYLLFIKKHRFNGAEFLLEFLDGKMSLEDFRNAVIGKKKKFTKKNYYQPRKFGSKVFL